VQRYLRDPTFSRFDTIPECDRQTHTQTDRHMTTVYTTLSKASRGKNATFGRQYVVDIYPVSRQLRMGDTFAVSLTFM